MVVSHLELNQLNSAFGICRVNRTDDVTITIGRGAHHYPIPYSMRHVPISPFCGSRMFELRVYVRYVSGNPLKLDGARPGGAEPEAYTNAIAVSSMPGTPTTVPNVIGLDETAAASSIVAAGLAVGAVSRVASSAPTGTVISQNASARTVEPAGSPVDLTVSLGTVPVPYVLSLPRTDAISILTGLDLSVAVSFQKECINPDGVLTQNPSAGAAVLPGSTVSIKVDSGTTSTCIIQ